MAKKRASKKLKENKEMGILRDKITRNEIEKEEFLRICEEIRLRLESFKNGKETDIYISKVSFYGEIIF